MSEGGKKGEWEGEGGSEVGREGRNE